MGRVLSLGARLGLGSCRKSEAHVQATSEPLKKPSPVPTQHGELQFLSSCVCSNSVPNPATVGNLKDGRLHVETVMDGPVNEVQVPVRSPTGEITYKTFIAATPSTFELGQGSADERLVEKAQEESDLYSSTSAPTGPDTSDHQHVLHDRSRGISRAKKAVDDQPEPHRGEGADIDGSPFSVVDSATADDCASLYSFM